MAKDVMCTVENCQYWNNRSCEAQAIEVSVDSGASSAKKNADTNCHTFVDKNR